MFIMRALRTIHLPCLGKGGRPNCGLVLGQLAYVKQEIDKQDFLGNPVKSGSRR